MKLHGSDAMARGADEKLVSRRIKLPKRIVEKPLRQVSRRLLMALFVMSLTVLIVWIDRDGYHDNANNKVDFLDCVYYATVTLSTTGYGDIVPYSDSARLVNVLLITPLRVLFLIILVGTTLEVLTERTREEWRLSRWRKNLREHTVVVGFGTKGRSALQTLLATGLSKEQVVIVDPSAKVIDIANAEGFTGVVGDATRSEVLLRAEIQKARQIVIATQRDDTAVLVTLTARQLNRGAKIVAAVREEENAPLLRQSGADAVITSASAAGRLLGLGAQPERGHGDGRPHPAGQRARSDRASGEPQGGRQIGPGHRRPGRQRPARPPPARVRRPAREPPPADGPCDLHRPGGPAEFASGGPGLGGVTLHPAGPTGSLRAMYAITIEQPGGPEALVWAEAPDPVAGDGEVIVEVAASAVNRADVLQRQGFYNPPPGASPHPGLECSGRISAIGPGVSGWSVGDEVCALLAGGGYAQRVAVPAGQLLPVPAGVDLVTAAALPEVVSTVWSNVFMVAGLRPGETLLVHGGSSGIGTMAIQLAKAVGARVAVTAGGKEKLARCAELGADILIDYREQDFVEEIRAATGGAGADVILDIMGAKYLTRNVDALAVNGRLAIIGLQGGVKAELNLAALLAKRAAITATTLRARPLDEKAAIVAAVREHVWPLVATGRIHPVVHGTFPMREAAEAHRVLESSTHVGKLLLTT